MATHFSHVILYKKEVDYTANEFHLQGSESRQCPHLHILSPNTKTSVHTIHQIESFSFLPLQLEKRMGWKMLCSQQVLDCCALAWFASSFTLAEWPMSSSPTDLCSRLPTRLTKCPTVITAHVRCWGGVRYRATYRACMAILLVAASHERSIKTCRPPAVLDVNQGCTVSQKCSS